MALFDRRSKSRERSRGLPLRSALIHRSKCFEVFWSFLQCYLLLALDHYPDRFHHVRISQGCDISGVHVVGEGRENTPHQLAGPCLWHIRNNENPARAGDLANHRLDDVIDPGQDLRMLSWQYIRLHDDIDFGHAALDFVHHRHHCRFCHLRNGQACRLDFLRTQAVASHVNDVIHAPQYPKIAIHGQHGSIRRKIRPVAPILALRILAVLSVVLVDKALPIAPDGLHDSGPGIPNANVSCLPRTGGHDLSQLVDDYGEDTGHTWARAPGLHGIQRWLGGTEEPSVLGLPPGVHDHGFTFAPRLVVPQPAPAPDRV